MKVSNIRKYVFHKGFYENSQQDIKYQLFRIKDKNEKDCFSAEDFLHGICHVFAYALHCKFGYNILEIRSLSNLMVHWCCTFDYKGKKVYVDVRGMTSDFNELIDEFQPGMGEAPIKTIIEDLTNYDDEWEESQVKFANEIIKKHYDYYSI